MHHSPPLPHTDDDNYVTWTVCKSEYTLSLEHIKLMPTDKGQL